MHTYQHIERTHILSFELEQARNNTYIKDTHHENEQVKIIQLVPITNMKKAYFNQNILCFFVNFSIINLFIITKQGINLLIWSIRIIRIQFNFDQMI